MRTYRDPAKDADSTQTAIRLLGLDEPLAALQDETPGCEANICRKYHSGPGRLRGRWFWLASAAAVLAAVGSAVGLSPAADIYGQETAILAAQ